MANGLGWHRIGMIWMDLPSSEIPDRPPVDFRASAVRTSRGVIRCAHPSGRTELRALLRYAPFLQRLHGKHRG